MIYKNFNDVYELTNLLYTIRNSMLPLSGFVDILKGRDLNDEILENICKRGFDINSRDSSGGTLLYDAACKGNEEKALLLLKHGADPCCNVQIELITYKNGNSSCPVKTKVITNAVQAAEDNKHIGIAKLLKRAANGENIFVNSEDAKTEKQMQIKKQEPMSMVIRKKVSENVEDGQDDVIQREDNTLRQ